MTAKGVWLFGYGSLIWKQGFPYSDSEPAWIDGYTRRFWQGSYDHRGTPHAPGRVVTLIRDIKNRCFGRAFHIPPAAAEAVIRSLDHREKGGYQRTEIEIHLRESVRPVSGIVYIAPENNPNFLGPATVSEMAKQIHTAKGPSGDNRHYVFRLKTALDDMGVEDPHVVELEDQLRNL